MMKLTSLSDLHMHLGSASTAHLLWELAHQRGINLPEKNYWKFLDWVKIDHQMGWESYHNYFDMTQNIQSSPDAIEKSVHEAVSLSYRKANIDLLEVRFNPMRRNSNKLYDLDRVIFSAIVGMKTACMIYPVRAALILEMDRRFSVEQNRVIVEKAIKYRNEGIVGIDLSGPNSSEFEMSDILTFCDKAKSYGLGVTIHTGEATGVEEMNYVIDYIRPHRIGHGIACVEDHNLMQKIIKQNVTLEICPTSNVLLKIVPGWNEMANIISTLKQVGVKFTINSDSPVLLQTNAKQEMENLLERNILKEEDVKTCINNARKATFTKLAY